MKSIKTIAIIAVPLALLALVIWFVFFHQSATDPVKQGADKYAHAILTGDFANAVALTQPHLVDLSGGKAKMISALTDQAAKFRDQNVGYDTITPGDPQSPQKIGAWTISLVPAQIVLKAPGGRLKAETFLLGMSDDDGKNWTYVSLSMTADQFFQVYPELKGKFAFPDKKAPVVEKNP